VRLVHRKKSHPEPLENSTLVELYQPFRRQVQQLDAPLQQRALGCPPLRQRATTVERNGGDPQSPKLCDLVLHQGDQR
jgi:hypothetical protein